MPDQRTPPRAVRKSGLRPFYPILPDATWIERLVPLGIGVVQLRCKVDDQPTRLAQIRQSLAVCARHQCQLIVNDHWADALLAGATAVHLGQEDMAGADFAELKRRGVAIGLSTHNDTELDRALAEKPDAVALGPIFRPGSKIVDHPTVGISAISRWRARVGDLPLVAIGGITLATASEVIAAGADSVAIITDITNSLDPVARVRQWLDWEKRLLDAA